MLNSTIPYHTVCHTTITTTSTTTNASYGFCLTDVIFQRSLQIMPDP